MNVTERQIIEKSWRELVLTPLMNFGIQFDKGWLFARTLINSIVPYLYDRWDSLAAASGDTDYSVPQDSNNNDIFYVENSDEIWQVFQEWNHPRLRIHTRIPRPEVARYLQGEIGNPTITGTFGWMLEGWESPKGNGTGRGMFFVPYQVNVEFAKYNPESFRVQPINMFYINKMRYAAFNPREKLGVNMIKGILQKRIPCLLWQADIIPFIYKQNFAKIFGVEPIAWDGLEATVGSGKNLETIYSVGGD